MATAKIGRLPRSKASKQKICEFLEGTSRLPDPLLMSWVGRIAALSAGETATGRAQSTASELLRETKAVDGFARSMIKDFCLRQWLGQPQSPVTLEWLTDVLDGIIDHGDPMKLLGLMPRPRHRPRDPWHPGGEIAVWLRIAVARGYEPAEASEMAAQLFAKDLKTIERYRRDSAVLLEWASSSEEHWERWFSTMVPPRPLPSAKSKKSGVIAPTESR